MLEKVTQASLAFIKARTKSYRGQSNRSFLSPNTAVTAPDPVDVCAPPPTIHFQTRGHNTGEEEYPGQIHPVKYMYY